MSLVEVGRRGGVAWLLLNRAEKGNALSAALAGELAGAARELASDPHVGAVVLSARGKHFCSGADLSPAEGEDALGGGEGFAGKLVDALVALEGIPVPVVAAARGAVLGFGVQLLLAADLRIVTEETRIGVPASRLGLVINLEGAARLLLELGSARAAEVLLAGRELSGREAAALGLVTRAVPEETLEEEAGRVAEELASLPAAAIRGNKAALRAVLFRLLPRRENDRDLFQSLDALALRALEERRRRA